jgi:hypothetical protein
MMALEYAVSVAPFGGGPAYKDCICVVRDGHRIMVLRYGVGKSGNDVLRFLRIPV